MKKLVALLLTGVLMIGSTMSVFAEDVESVTDDSISYDVKGDVKGDVSVSGKKVTVEEDGTEGGDVGGNVVANGTHEVIGTDEETGLPVIEKRGSSVVVQNNVLGSAVATVNSKIDVGQNVGGNIIADDDSVVNVGRSACGAMTVVNNSKANVGGNAGSVMAAGASEVKVDGNVSGGVQINDGPSQKKGESKITVGGDVEKGVSFDFATRGSQNYDASGIVIVEGTVKASESGIAVHFGSKETAENSTLVAYKTEGEIIRFDNKKPDELGSPVDASDKVFYIIKKDADDIGLSGTTKKEGYDTAHMGEVVTITVANGYEASSTAGTIEKNADGTYKITIPAGGGVTISAIKAAIEEMESNGKSEAVIEVPASDNDQDDDSDSEDSSSSDPAPAAQAPAVDTTSRLDASAMSVEQYTGSIVNMIAQSPAGGTVSFEITDAAYLNDMIISALKVRSDVSIRLIVKFMGVDYSIVIPAGYDLGKLTGADGKIDFATILKTFGAKAVQ